MGTPTSSKIRVQQLRAGIQARRVPHVLWKYDLGLKVTLNTDDPGLFSSGTLGSLLPPVAAAGNFKPADIAQFMIHAFETAWISADRRAGYVAEVKAYLASQPADFV